MKVRRVIFAIVGIALLVTIITPVAVSADTGDNLGKASKKMLKDAPKVDEIIVPGVPPGERISEAPVSSFEIKQADAVLSNVPAFDWCYGCSATSAAMMFGYYDRTGYSNMYAGPTNGGVCPLDNSDWGSSECPLSATHQGYDDLAVKGHVDDYWSTFGSTVDPYDGNWAEHGYADCTADFMGTNQYQNWQNKDGSTRFYYTPYPSGAPLYDYTGYEPDGKRDGCHGIRLFVESRGYNVIQNYNQRIDAQVPTGGFTYANFKAEIDAGRPVIIHVTKHSMLGYGYDDPDTIYIHDTWDHSDHYMTWGGTYSDRQHYGVTVIEISYTCGNMGVNPTSWSPTLSCGKSDNEIVTVSATGGTVEGVTVSKVSGPTWLSVSPPNLGDIASGSSNTFTMTAAPPAGTSGDFTYTVRVSNTCGTPSTRDVSGTIHVDCCGNMGVNPTSWSPTLNCGESDNEIVTVSATGGTVEGVTVSKVSGPTWLSVSPPNLGDIASGSSNTFTMTAAPPAGTSGDFTYTVRVSNTCGTPPTRDVTGTIHVDCCGNMGVNPTSWGPTLNCSESDNEIVTVSATGGTVKGVTVSKVSGPTWLSVSPANLGDIASGSSNTFTVTAAPPAGTSGDFTYTVRVSNTCGTPSTRDVSGTIHVSCPCGNMGVNPTSWGPTLNCGESDNEIVTVSATGGTVKGVTVSKVSGPTWLSVSPANLGDIASGSSKTFTITASPPSETSGDFPYTVRVSNTCGTPSTRDVSGTIHVDCPCGNMGVNPTSWSPTLNCSESDNEVVTVSATGGTVEGVTVSKVSGPTWLSVSPTNLGDIASGSSNTFTMTASPPSETSGDFTYTVRVSNTCGTPSSRDVTGTIHVDCPELSYSPTSHDFGDMCEGETGSTTFELWNSGTGTLTYTLSETCDWVEVNPTSGSSTGEHDTIMVDIDTTGLSEGTHTCDISINSNDGTGTFTVTVNVVPCPESSWTYMVYLDGDNNLEGAGIDDFLEMSSVGSTSDVNIVVQFDRIPGYSSAYDDWTTCKRFLVTQGMTPTPVNALMDLGECNMGDPDTLRAFVEWAMAEYPADNYALILWNHGSGYKKWVPWADETGIDRGICYDDTDGDHLTLQETEQALAGKHVEVLGYDACLMHMIEVVYQVRTHAAISVGSEEYEPGDGWPYNTILGDLTGTPTMTPSTLGDKIVSRYIASYAPAGDETQSAVDKAKVSNLASAVDTLAQVLIDKLPDDYAKIQQARNGVEEFVDPDFIDLYHFAELIKLYLSDNPAAVAAAQAVMDNVDNTVTAEGHGTAHPNAHGLSIYFPEAEWAYLSSYENTKFAVDTHWDEFLKEYYAPSKPDLIITDTWLCWPDNCTICYNVTNTGDGTAPACHNTTLYVDDVAVAHDHVPVELAPGESYIGCFDGYTWTYTPPSDNITVCADNSETLDELDEDNNCLTNIWMCGDVNGDRAVNVIDVVLIYKRALDPGYPLDLPWAGDVNCDCNINVIDVVMVYKRALDPGYDLDCCCEVV